MNATEEMCRLLDERGAEYRFNDATKVFEWHFDGTDGEGSAHATEVNGGINIIACSLTPEQAIAATLGPRTCRKLPSSGETRCFVSRYGYEREFGYWKCSNCGVECFEGAKYCMNCGAKAVDCGTKVADYG